MVKGIGKTKIEWCDLRWNPITGCDNIHCKCRSVCYAKGIATRFAGTANYPNGFDPTFRRDILKSPFLLKKKNQKIFVCSMGELYMDGRETWTSDVLDTITKCTDQTFITLTKQTRNLYQWSPFPSNCWVGASATCEADVITACRDMATVIAPVKFLSIEPLLRWDRHKHMDWFDGALHLGRIRWVIIGAQTKPYRPPSRDSVVEIFNACVKAGAAIFLKDSLKPLLIAEQLRQDWPDESQG